MNLVAETHQKTVPVRELLDSRNIRPFCQIAVAWLLIGAMMSGDPKWFLVIAAAVLLDLFLLLKVVATLLVFVSHKGRSGESVSSTHVAFWFAAKLVGFGVLLAALLVSRKALFQAVLLGVGTFVIVPLIGGLWWGQRNLKPESSDYAWE